MSDRAAEEPIIVASELAPAKFVHDELRAHHASGFVLDRDIRDHAACHRARRLGVRIGLEQPADPQLQLGAVVVHVRRRPLALRLAALDRHPVVGVRFEQLEPFLEPTLVEQVRLVIEEALGACQQCAHVSALR